MMNLLGDLDDPQLAGDEKLAALVQEIRAYAGGPAPEARPALMAVLTRGLAGPPGHGAPPVPVPAPAASRRRLGERLQTSRARLVLGAAVASVGFLSTGAAGALPGPAQSAFARATTAVGIELPEATESSEGLPGSSDRLPDLPAGGRGQEGRADDASSRSGRRTEAPAPFVDDRIGAGGTSDIPPVGTGDGNRGGALGREAGGDGPNGRPLPAPRGAQTPELGDGRPLDGASRPAGPGRPELTDGRRPVDVPGADDGDEPDEEAPAASEIRPGGLPGNAGDAPSPCQQVPGTCCPHADATLCGPGRGGGAGSRDAN
ncbi:MAG: hypothetical protein KY447_10540 [Actinobacteria bacterium]|nr:hypothetical protein [Actinomycetota bacterium]